MASWSSSSSMNSLKVRGRVNSLMMSAGLGSTGSGCRSRHPIERYRKPSAPLLAQLCSGLSRKQALILVPFLAVVLERLDAVRAFLGIEVAVTGSVARDGVDAIVHRVHGNQLGTDAVARPSCSSASSRPPFHHLGVMRDKMLAVLPSKALGVLVQLLT